MTIIFVNVANLNNYNLNTILIQNKQQITCESQSFVVYLRSE